MHIGTGILCLLIVLAFLLFMATRTRDSTANAIYVAAVFLVQAIGIATLVLYKAIG